MQISLTISHNFGATDELVRFADKLRELLSSFTLSTAAAALSPAAAAPPKAPTPVATVEPSPVSSVANTSTEVVEPAAAVEIYRPKRHRRTKAEMEAARAEDDARAAAVAAPAPTAQANIFDAISAAPKPAEAAAVSVPTDREAVRNMVLELMDTDGGEVALMAALKKHGATTYKALPDAALGAFAVDINAAIRKAAV